MNELSTSTQTTPFTSSPTIQMTGIVEKSMTKQGKITLASNGN